MRIKQRYLTGTTYKLLHVHRVGACVLPHTVHVTMVKLKLFSLMYIQTCMPEEVRHACTNHYKFSALISLRSRDNVQAKCTELVVIRAPPLVYASDIRHQASKVIDVVNDIIIYDGENFTKPNKDFVVSTFPLPSGNRCFPKQLKETNY